MQEENTSFMQDIPEDLARLAHADTSFKPEKRAGQERQDYAQMLAGASRDPAQALPRGWAHHERQSHRCDLLAEKIKRAKLSHK